MVIGIDNGGAARIVWERQYPKDGNYNASHYSPLIEFNSSYFKFLLNIQHVFNDCKPVICLDPLDSSTVFRNKILEDYYATHLKVYTSPKAPSQVICEFDGIYRGVKHNGRALETVNLTAKKAKGILENGKSGFTVADRATLEWDMNCHIDQHIRPNYKYGRKWPYDRFCTKQTFNELRYKQVKAIAAHLGIEVWESPGLEADDLVYRLAEAHKNTDFIAMTTDADLDQIRTFHESAKFMRFKVNKLAEISQEEAKRKTWLKLLLGERSKGTDYIMPIVSLKTGAALTPAAANAIVTELLQLKGKEQADFLKEKVYMPSMKKNRDVMLLKAAPKPTTVPHRPEIIASLEEMFIDPAEINLWKNEAKFRYKKTGKELFKGMK